MQRDVDLAKAVEAFGGYSGLARELTSYIGRKVALSTVHGWKRRGSIPSWRQDDIKALAKAKKKSVCGPGRHRRRAHHRRRD